MTPRTTIRDRGLAMISRFNRWLIAGAVAASGLISLTAAHAFHGRTVSSNGSSSGASNASSAPAPSQSSSSQDAGGLSQPAQAPAPAQAAPSPVVSGGS